MKGWYKENYRHSLAAKGVKTNMFAKKRYNFVLNSLKGNRDTKLKIMNERGKLVSFKHWASSKGLEQGNRDDRRIGDTPDNIAAAGSTIFTSDMTKGMFLPKEIAAIPVPEQVTIPEPFQVPESSLLPMSQAVQSVVPAPLKEEVPMPVEPMAMAAEEQQAQPVEGGSQQMGSALSRPPETGIITTTGVPQWPSTLEDEERATA
jgi:hypothetical protein